jgi:hypothetical protein
MLTDAQIDGYRERGPVRRHRLTIAIRELSVILHGSFQFDALRIA